MMNVTFVGHASVIFRTDHTGVICDPWLKGRVFNKGWGLLPEPVFDPSQLKSLDYIWISHEHPDHLHFPTLRSFPNSFKSRATVIFQKNNSERVRVALKELGYRKFLAVPHRRRMQFKGRLGETGEWFAVYQHRHLDSALVVGSADGTTVINVNDADLTEYDCKKLRKEFGPFDATFRQFSIAGFDGTVDAVTEERQAVLRLLLDQHVWLGAGVTVPIASFMYFCLPDNQHLNGYANTALDALRECRKSGLACHLMYPGATRSIQDLKANEGDVTAFEKFYENSMYPIDPLELPVPAAEITKVFTDRVSDWKRKFPKALVNRIGVIPVQIRDLGKAYEFDFRNVEVRETNLEPNLVINSQPLYYAFSMPFGIQTLGVSGRYQLKRLSFEWKIARIISSLYNAEIYLRFDHLLSRQFLVWFMERIPDLFPTIRQQMIRFFFRK